MAQVNTPMKIWGQLICESMTRYAIKKLHNEAYLRNDWRYKSEFFNVYSLNYGPV